VTDRDRFLTTVRDRLAGGLPGNPLRPFAPAGDTTPEITYTVDVGDPVAAFTAAATAMGSEVVDLHEDAGLHPVLATLQHDGGVRTAIVSDDPECGPVPGLLTQLGIDRLPSGDPDAAARADLGVTGASHGIALTGSLVVDSRRAGTRLASLLPPTHLAILERANLLPTPGALLRHLDDHVPDGLPSNLVLITGHSRSADIELQLTPGVHGPRRLIVALR